MNEQRREQLIAWLESMPWWADLPYAKLEEKLAECNDAYHIQSRNDAVLKQENERLEDGRDRWHQRWGIAFDILDTTQRRQYEEEIDALLTAEEQDHE